MASAKHISDQLEWDWMVPTTKNLLRPDEAARYLGRSIDFIYGLIDEGELEAFAPLNREVERKVITRRSVVLYLARSAKSHPTMIEERAIAFLRTLDRITLTNILTAIQSK
jgi:excisionase family DNA binding protein